MFSNASHQITRHGSHGSPGSQVPADHRPAGGAADDLSKRAQSGQVPGNMVKIMDTGDLPSGDLPSGDLATWFAMENLPSGDLTISMANLVHYP